MGGGERGRVRVMGELFLCFSWFFVFFSFVLFIEGRKKRREEESREEESS